MAKAFRLVEQETGRVGVWFTCPGCNSYHKVVVDNKGQGPQWGWNGSLDSPTFTPSILVSWTYGPEKIKNQCHSFVTDGKIRFLNDCTHNLKGQIVDLPETKEI